MLSHTRMILSAAALAVFAGVSQTAMAADEGSARGAAPAEVRVLPGALPIRDADAPARRPLMGLLDKMGVAKTLDDNHIQIYGHAEGSYNYNFASPPSSLADYKLPVGKFIDNPGRVFDVEHDKVLLNQLTLNFERTVDAAQAAADKKWNIGGRVELMYGADARFLHSNGLFDHYDDDTTVRVTGGPQNHFDIPQAYIDVAAPVGNGLRFRVGKFIFFKNHDPNASVFYSHSFTFGAALPFTLTGGYATYNFSEQLSVDAGISRGWDQSLEDNNDAIDFLARVKYAPRKDMLLTLATIIGPEQDGDNDNYRMVFNLTASWQVSDNLMLLADGIYGQQTKPFGASGDARWYGAALYAIYQINPTVSAGARVEWYCDDGGYTTGLDQNLYEATVGLTIKPFPNDPILRNLKIRPEVRLDYSDEKYFDGFDSHMQVTAAIDAIFNF